ncbi:MAG: LuxR C-terminal-related transcriptional regulator [Candidatus Dormibacteraeota bacterium]|nr:LuxR C-terminal-related transcriptional regulator [Candidatus Dormibacteraeota bacterium]
MQFARLAGLGSEDVSDVYYLALLYHVGCTAAAASQARVGGGDDVSARRWFSEADYTDRGQLLRLAATRVGRDWGAQVRAQAVLGLVTAPKGFIAEAIGGICEVGARLGTRLGAGPRVTEALEHAYARWDGKIFANLPSGQSISGLARVVHVVRVARAFGRAGGREAADAVVRTRSGTELDPTLCDLWLGHSEELLQPRGRESPWDLAVDAEPHPHRFVQPSHIDVVTAAFADFVDLKASFTVGHSSRVAELAVAAGGGVGFAAGEVTALRRAALTHDLGNASVPNRILTKNGRLDRSEWERIRQHSYHSQRVLAVAEPLREIGELAGMHHERLDGSGYHRGLPAAAIPFSARVLATAEAYQSMVEERPWRAALSPTEAAAELRREAREGRLDRHAAEAVLVVAGQPLARRREARTWPAGLTDREVEVLRRLARGRSNKEIARELHLAEATVHSHVINLYGKIEVNTRAGAALFALERDLIQL